MDQFKKGDVSDIKYRKALIDTFVRRVVLFDNKMTREKKAEAGLEKTNSGQKEAGSLQSP